MSTDTTSPQEPRGVTYASLAESIQRGDFAAVDAPERDPMAPPADAAAVDAAEHE